jgi:hypothetical protein
MPNECQDTNVPSVNEDALGCCELHNTNCIILAEAVPCLQVGKGQTLTELLNRLCNNLSNLSSGLVEVEAGNGIDVNSSVDNNTTTYTVSTIPKKYFYREFVSDIDIVHGAELPGPDSYFFPTGYQNLTYQNTSGSDMVVEVHVSYETNIPTSVEVGNRLENWVDGAIVKTDTMSNDTVEYESLGLTDVEGYLYDTVDENIITGTTSEKVLTDVSSNPVKFKFTNITLPKNVSFFKVLTLQDEETVSLKFKSKPGSIGRLLKGQILVKEL